MKKIAITVATIAILISFESCKKEELNNNQFNVQPEFQQTEWQEGDQRLFADLRPFLDFTECVEQIGGCMPFDIILTAGESYVSTFKSLVDSSNSAVGNYFNGDDWSIVLPDLDNSEYTWLINELKTGNYQVTVHTTNGIEYYQFRSSGDLSYEPLYVLPIEE